MNAYQVTELDWYAANSWEEAVALACTDSGESPEDTVDYSVASGEPEDPNARILVSIEGEETMTIAESLAEMDGPGWCFGKES
tara:strand:- start:2834 stop:3082 length:249 start_codon:yes stop_codon:yes gene_type:complete